MNIDEFIGQVFSKALTLKPPVVVTDRYIGEKYNRNQICSKKSRLNNETRVIYLREVNLDVIPPWVFDVEGLEGLLLDKNPNLNIRPKEISNLENLKVLGLMQTNIIDFTFLKEAYALESLDISVNYLDVFPEEICMLKELRYLDVSSFNGFTSIPKCINNATNLRSLRIHYNEIKSLPEEIGYLDKLEQLIISGNELEYIPRSIYNLKALRELDLSVNNIKEIDFRRLSNIKNLDEIYTLKNPLKNLPDGLFDQCKGILSATCLRKYFSGTSSKNDVSSKINKHSSMPKEERIYSIRALIVRSLFYCISIEWERSYDLLIKAFQLSEDEKHNKFCIFCGVMLGYLESIQSKNKKGEVETFQEASLWAGRINKYTNTADLRNYRISCNQLILVMWKLSVSEEYNVEAKEKNDFHEVASKILSWDLSVLETEYPNDFIKKYNIFSDAEIINKLNNKKYLHGVIENNLWDLVDIELSSMYEGGCQSDNYYNNFIDYKVDKDREVLIYFIKTLETEDIKIVVNFNYGKTLIIRVNSPFYTILKISDKLFHHNSGVQELDAASSGISLESKNNHILSKENENEVIFSPLWDSIFESRINYQYLYDREIKEGGKIKIEYANFHELLQRNNINKIYIIPINNFTGIPLGSAYSSTRNSYAAEYYDIVFKPIVVPYKNYNFLTENDLISILKNTKLPFSRAENEIIGSLFEDSFKVNISSHPKTFKKELELSSIIHAATHLENNTIKITGHEGGISINNTSISSCNLNCNLSFINACKSSTGIKNYESKDSLPVNFIKSGSKTVISTSAKLPDADAFRFSTRFYELCLENKDFSYIEIFHMAIKEAIQLKIPFYWKELREMSEEKISKTMEYRETYKSSVMISWKYYMVWDGTYVRK